MVSVKCKCAAMQVQVEGLYGPNHSKQFPLIGTVDTFMRVERARDTRHHVLVALVIQLCENSGNALVAKICLQYEGFVKTGALKGPTWSCKLFFETCKGMLALR